MSPTNPPTSQQVIMNDAQVVILVVLISGLGYTAIRILV